MFDVYAGIDHRNGDVGAAGQRMRLGQSKLRKRVLRGIALGQCRLLLLQEMTEIQLHRANAGLGGEFAAHCLGRSAIGDAEQADGRAYKRKILRLQTRQAVTPRQLVSLGDGQRAVDLGDDLACDRTLVEYCLRNNAPRTAVFVLVLVLARRPAAAPGTCGTAAIGRQHRLTGAFAIAVAVGVAARRICPEIGRHSAGNVGIDARHHGGVDGRNPRLDVEVGRTHNALRLKRRATEIRKWQSRNGQGQRRAPRLHPPICTIVDHETSAYALWRRHQAPYCAGTARLTVFSLCSLLIRPAISSFVIALLPNCSWNGPPWFFIRIAPRTPACNNSASAPRLADKASVRGESFAKNSEILAARLSEAEELRAGSPSIAPNSSCMARADGAPRLSLR